MKTTIVIPVYNGAKTIGLLIDELISRMEQKGLEIVLVNDGSSDNSHDVCLAIFKKYNSIVKYINLARNFGEHNAVMAGLNHSTGDYMVIIDDDFQNPPEEIAKLIDVAIAGGHDVVYSYYAEKQHSLFRNLGSRFNNLVASCLLHKPKDLYLSSFKCMNRFVVNEVIKYKGPFPYVDGLIWRSTRNVGKVLVRHEKRLEGRSNYTLRKLVRLWTNMFVNFSVYPLRMSTFLGIIFSFIGIIFSVLAIIDKLIHPEIPMGITSIMVAILAFAGVQLLMLGLIGEYLGKLFLANNQTPQYVERCVFEDEKANEK